MGPLWGGPPGLRPTPPSASSTCFVAALPYPARKRVQGDPLRPGGPPHNGPSFDMCHTCFYALGMPKTIQVRGVPDDVHGLLKARAAREGMSLSDFLKREFQRTAARPSVQEWLDRAQQAKPILAKMSPARAVRELREAR